MHLPARLPPPLPRPTDPTYRLPNVANLPKRYTPQAAFHFALPGPQVRAAASTAWAGWHAVAVCQPARGASLAVCVLPEYLMQLANAACLHPTMRACPQFLDNSFEGPGGEPVRQGEPLTASAC
jgi:hypothetical protein